MIRNFCWTGFTYSSPNVWEFCQQAIETPFWTEGTTLVICCHGGGPLHSPHSLHVRVFQWVHFDGACYGYGRLEE